MLLSQNKLKKKIEFLNGSNQICRNYNHNSYVHVKFHGFKKIHWNQIYRKNFNHSSFIAVAQLFSLVQVWNYDRGRCYNRCKFGWSSVWSYKSGTTKVFSSFMISRQYFGFIQLIRNLLKRKLFMCCYFFAWSLLLFDLLQILIPWLHFWDHCALYAQFYYLVHCEGKLIFRISPVRSYQGNSLELN